MVDFFLFNKQGRNLGNTSYSQMRRPRRQHKSSNFKISGYIGGRAYSGLRGRKNYYNKASDMQNIPYRGTNGKPIWLKFVQKGIVEDCPICNPDIELLYRLNPEDESVVHTNFDMTQEIEPLKKRFNYKKHKGKYKTCVNHPVIDHEHHKFSTVKNERFGKNSMKMTDKKMHTFVEKYGKSINRKMKFKKSPSNSTLKYSNPKKRIYNNKTNRSCLLYTSPSPRDLSTSRMPSSA